MQLSIDRWMDKKDVIYIYIYTYIYIYIYIHTHTHSQWNITEPWKEWNNVICSNMDGPRDCHTKRSKSESERQIPYDINYMWNLKYDTNELIHETETDSQT